MNELTWRPTLPSVEAAQRLWILERGAAYAIIETVLGRSVLIALGILASGKREHVVRHAIAGSIAIEAFVLWDVRRQLIQKQTEKTDTVGKVT